MADSHIESRCRQSFFGRSALPSAPIRFIRYLLPVTNKEINRESRRIFEGLLLSSWAFRPQEDQEDYGIDGEIEITTPEDKASGFIFKVQLKGTEVGTYDAADQLVFSEARVERFTYYITKVAIPVVFVVCDISTGKCYWAQVQGNSTIEAAWKEAQAKKQQTFTIKFPPSKTLVKAETSANEVIEAVARASGTIALRSVQKLAGENFQKYLVAEPDLEATEKKLRRVASLASSARVRQMLRTGDLDGAGKKAMEILENGSEPCDARIDAGVCLVMARRSMLLQTQAPSASFEAARFQLGVASRMLEIVRATKCEKRIQAFVRVYVRAARMQMNGKVALALVVSEESQRRQGSTMAGPITTIQRIEVSNRVVRDFLRLHRLLARCVIEKQYYVVPFAVREMAEAIYPFVQALRFLKQTELAQAYAEAIWQTVPFAVEVARHLLDEETAEDVLRTLGIRLVGLGDQPQVSALRAVARRYEQALTREPPLARLKEIIGPIDEILTDLERNPKLKKEPTMAEARAHYEAQAAAFGIDLKDPHDQTAQVVRIGLEDLDPTRIARDCAHIHIRPESYGVPGEMLGLPTAGSKTIFCLRHRHGLTGFRLDDIYPMFSRHMPWDKGEFRCENCPDKSPHPEGWTWTFEYGNAQEQRYRALPKNED